MDAIIIPAATVSVAREDLTLGLVCFDNAMRALGDRQKAGRLKGYVEATLDANPGLAGLGLILPLKTVIHLPEFTVISGAKQAERLWDE